MKFKDRFFMYDSADERWGFCFVKNPHDWLYLDIYFGLKFIMICLRRLK